MTTEWGKEGNVHWHVIFMMRDVPGMGFLERELECDDSGDLEGRADMREDRVRVVTRYYERTISEYNPAKPNVGAEDAVRGEGEVECGGRANAEPEHAVRGEGEVACGGRGSGGPKRPGTVFERPGPKRRRRGGYGAVESWADARLAPVVEVLRAFAPAASDAESDLRDAFERRVALLGRLVEDGCLHDYHDPPLSTKPERGTCSRAEKGTAGTLAPKYYCSQDMPKLAPRPEGMEEVYEDARRPRIYKLALARNCAFTTKHWPMLVAFLQASVDHGAVLTLGGIADYITKLTNYVTKAAGRTDSKQLSSELWDECAKRAASGVFGSVAKYMNAKNCPGIVPRMEVEHHNMKLPGTRCSREFVALWYEGGKRFMVKGEMLRRVLQRDGREGDAGSRNEREVYGTRCPCVEEDSVLPCGYDVSAKEAAASEDERVIEGCAIARASRYTLRKWYCIEEGRYAPVAQANVVKLKPYLDLKAPDGPVHARVARMVLGFFVNFPNEVWRTVDAVDALGDGDAVSWLRAVLGVEGGGAAMREEYGICAPPRWLVEKYVAGRESAARKAAQSVGGRVGSIVDETVCAVPGGSGAAAQLQFLEQERQGELRAAVSEKQGDAVLRRTVDSLRKGMVCLPRRGGDDLRNALLVLRQPLGSEDARRLGIPEHTDVAYYLALRAAFADPEALVGVGVGKQQLVDAGGHLGIAGLAACRKRQVVERLAVALGGEGLPGEFGRGVRRKRRRVASAGRDGGSEESGSEEEVVVRVTAWSGGRQVVTEPYQEQYCLHSEVMPEGPEEELDALQGDKAELAEDRYLKAAGISVVDLRVAAVQGPEVAELSRGKIEATLKEGPRDAETLAQLRSGVLGTGLDFTQGLLPPVVRRWLNGGGRASSGKPPRVLLVGKAGAGKTRTIGGILREVVLWEDEERDQGRRRPRPAGAEPEGQAYAVCAWIAKAAQQVGFGATTMSYLLGMMGDGTGVCKGSTFERVKRHFENVHVLVIDEISTVENDKLALASRTLDHVMREIRGLPADQWFEWGFGGLAVVLGGDFAQLPPVVKAGYLLSDRAGGEWRTLGRRLFCMFTQVIKLRRVYRQERGTEKERRYNERVDHLRDCAPRAVDWHFADRELAFERMDSEQQALFESEDTVWLCAENQRVGERNAAALARAAVQRDVAVVACGAHYPQANGAGRSALQFKPVVRHSFRCFAGAKVVLTSNYLWGQNVVRLGLTNGSPGIVRTWALGPADPAGSQVTSKGAAPRPFFYFVVEFATYTGAPFFAGEGREKWVPVGPEKSNCKVAAGVERCGCPLVLGYGVTGHKAQGSNVWRLGVDYGGDYMHPARIAGWPYVAESRAISGERVAIVGLPPIAEFLEARNDEVFRMRAEWEGWFDEQHDAFLREVGATPETEVEAHRLRTPEDEWDDVRAMLEARGVRDVSRCALELAAHAPAFRPSQGEALASGRRRIVRDGYKIVRVPRAAGPGHPPADADADAGADADADEDVPPPADGGEGALAAVRRALEGAVVSGVARVEAEAVVLALTARVPFAAIVEELVANGVGQGVAERAAVGSSTVAEAATKVFAGVAALEMPPPRQWEFLGGVDPELGYVERAALEPDWGARVCHDYGQFAGGLGNSCLWLSAFAGVLCVPGWECGGELGRVLAPYTDEAREEVMQAARGERGASAADGGVLRSGVLRPGGVEDDGAFRRGAHELRKWVCGEMLGRDMCRLLPFFCGEDDLGACVRGYLDWVRGVATGEMADELCVSVLARHLRVGVGVVRWNKDRAADPSSWLVARHGASAGEQAWVVLGNNDAHYVPLLPAGAVARRGRAVFDSDSEADEPARREVRGAQRGACSVRWEQPPAELPAASGVTSAAASAAFVDVEAVYAERFGELSRGLERRFGGVGE